jgi:hypothetical protein
MEMRCETCKWWFREREADPDGTCRRHPPTVFVLTVFNPITRVQSLEHPCYWPRTRPELLCGEFRGRES